MPERILLKWAEELRKRAISGIGSDRKKAIRQTHIANLLVRADVALGGIKFDDPRELPKATTLEPPNLPDPFPKS